MTPQEGEKLIAAIRDLIDRPLPKGPTIEQARNPKNRTGEAPESLAGENGKGSDTVAYLKAHPDILEALYVQFKNRMIDDLRIDPVFVQLIAQRPEIEVLVEPRRIQLEHGTLRGRLGRLIVAGWFDITRATSATRWELKRTGSDPGGGGTLSDTLSAFVKDGILVRDGDAGYQKVPGLIISERVIEAR